MSKSRHYIKRDVPVRQVEKDWTCSQHNCKGKVSRVVSALLSHPDPRIVDV